MKKPSNHTIRKNNNPQPTHGNNKRGSEFDLYNKLFLSRRSLVALFIDWQKTDREIKSLYGFTMHVKKIAIIIVHKLNVCLRRCKSRVLTNTVGSVLDCIQITTEDLNARLLCVQQRCCPVFFPLKLKTVCVNCLSLLLLTLFKSNQCKNNAGIIMLY